MMDRNTPMSRTVLFLCTGNFYRSRFAEAWFNHRAAQSNLPWRADSRGLAIGTWQSGWGSISPYTIEELARRGVRVNSPLRRPLACTLADLEAAELVVAVKEAEHRDLLAAQFGSWADRVEYWHVDDLDFAGPDEALEELSRYVEGLIERLSAQ